MNQNASTDTSQSASFGAPAEEISRRAYELWENEGRPEGNDMRHWLQAEQELGARQGSNSSSNAVGASASSATATSAPRNTGTDTRPLQGTRAAAAAQREPKRGTNVPFGSEKSGANNGQNGAKRRPSSAATM